MFKPLPLFLGLRMAARRPRQGFVSFVSVSAVMGVAFGVATLIVVMSVMNGFSDAITHRFLRNNATITLAPSDGHWRNPQPIYAFLKKQKAVIHFAPFIATQGVLVVDHQWLPVQVRNKHVTVHPKDQTDVMDISASLAQHYGWQEGDVVMLMVNHIRHMAFQSLPAMKRVKVHITTHHPHQDRTVFVHPKLLRAMLEMPPKSYHGIGVQVGHPESSFQLTDQWSLLLAKHWLVEDWSEKYQSFFQVLALQKSMMFLVLSLIVVIAAFGLVSGQVMLVVEKKKEIAILSAMGMPDGHIRCLFLIRGMMLGLLGIAVGTWLGWTISRHATALVDHIESWLGHPWLSHALYQMDHLPSKIVLSDVWSVVAVAVSLCVLASLYPAWMASRLKPIAIFQER